MSATANKDFNKAKTTIQSGHNMEKEELILSNVEVNGDPLMLKNNNYMRFCNCFVFLTSNLWNATYFMQITSVLMPAICYKLTSFKKIKISLSWLGILYSSKDPKLVPFAWKTDTLDNKHTTIVQYFPLWWKEPIKSTKYLWLFTGQFLWRI